MALSAVVLPLVAITAVALAVLWPTGDAERPAGYERPDRVTGTVLEVRPCSPALESVVGPGPTGECRSTFVRLDDNAERTGATPGEVVEAPVPLGAGAPRVEAGDDVVLFYSPGGLEAVQWSIADFDRSTPMYLLVVVFALAVIALSRWRGVAALLSLGASLALVLWFVLPNLLEGRSPLLVAIVAASGVMIVTLYLGHGIRAVTSVALIGTLISLVLAGVLGAYFSAAAQFTGFSNESVSFLSALRGDLDYEGLILAGLIIGALGVLDDITVTQAAAVWELRGADPSMSRRRVFNAAMRIGRSHVTAAVNTLCLAYASSMLPLLLLLSLTSSDFTSALLSDGIGQEVLRGLVGSLGIVAAVPITTAIGVLVVGGPSERDDEPVEPTAGDAGDPEATPA